MHHGRAAANCVAIMFVLVGFSACKRTEPESRSTIQRSVQVPGTLVTLREQGWSDADAEWFYNVSQGSQLIPFEWVNALKSADGTQSFIQVIPKFGYIPRRKTDDNPLGLPVGFVKGKGDSRYWLGLNCAACHTAVIEYDGHSYLVDGGPTLADVQSLLAELDKILDVTINDESRFDEFARQVLGKKDNREQRKLLIDDLKDVAKKRRDYNDRNMPKREGTQFGFGRVDAIGAIMNEVTVRFLGQPDNHRPADAPVSYPFLWDTPHHDRVEWNGSAPNTIFDLGNLARNTGEVLGVFGDIEIPEDAPLVGYRSTVNFDSLREIESKLKRLQSPLWPTKIPRSTNRAMIAAGQKHFKRLCASCHQFSKGNRSDPDREIVANMADVGTDRWMAENFRLRNVATGTLEGTSINFNPIGGKFGPRAAGETVLVHVIIGAILGSWKDAPPDELERLKRRQLQLKSDESDNKYKGRPLNGIWATAPYLHNGSVPTLRDLLKKAADRPKVFWVGSRKFDADDVGFEYEESKYEESSNSFKFDTALRGNSNSGHEYGTGVSKEDGGDGVELKPNEIDELLEYMKTL